MKKFTIIAGLNDQYTKKQEITITEAYNRIITALKNHGADGATFTECKGVYIHNDGTPVFENSIKIELLFIEYEAVKAIADELKNTLNQEAVVIEVTEINSELY